MSARPITLHKKGSYLRVPALDTHSAQMGVISFRFFKATTDFNSTAKQLFAG